jgi:hypothetical protein
MAAIDEARDAMIAADRDRARIAYAGIDFDRWSDARIRRKEKSNCDSAAYAEADARFRAASARFDKLDRGRSTRALARRMGL